MHLKLRKEKGHSELGSGSLPHLDDHRSCQVIRALNWGRRGEDVEEQSAEEGRPGRSEETCKRAFQRGVCYQCPVLWSVGIQTDLWVWQQEQFQRLDG